MIEKRKQEIENIVIEILRNYKESPPYMLFHDIFKSENIGFKEIQADDETFLGLYFIFEEKKKIRVRSNIEPFGRKNFTIAHELGHYFLSHELKNIVADTKETIFGKNINEQETEANYFASQYLMPKEQTLLILANLLIQMDMTRYIPLYVDKQPCNYGPWKIISNNMSQQLGVSREALQYRLEELKVLKFAL